MKLLIIALALTTTKKDSLPPKPDTATVIMKEFLIFLQDKITVKDYLPFERAVGMYLQQREFLKPKKK